MIFCLWGAIINGTQGSYIGSTAASQAAEAGSTPVPCSSKKSLLSYDKRDFLSDAFLSERDAHCVRDAGFARDARLRRVNGTHRITYHSVATSLITYLQTILLCDIISKNEVCIMSESKLRELSMEFSVNIIESVKNPKNIIIVTHLSD